MFQYTQYIGRIDGVRGGIVGLPPWARLIVGVFAIPGVVLLGLSILAIVVSVSALLLLTVPVYSLLRQLTMPRPVQQAGGQQAVDTPGVKRVEATIIE